MPLQQVPFTSVKIDDRFWKPRQDTNRLVSLPHALAMLKEAGNIGNMELASEGARQGFKGYVFQDSDLYKVIEAISYSLATHPNSELEAELDALIEKIRKAQMPDGYLDTYYEINAPDKRWSNLRDHHELYCAGHLIEAAVAHNRATGKRTLLDVAIKLADCIDGRFGDPPRKHEGYPGHPELELALVKLWRLTGEKRYFDLAFHFITHRGEKYFAKEHGTPLDRYDGTYWQDNVPIRDQTMIVGHAVRAAYLLSGVTDVVSEKQDDGLETMLHRVWDNAVGTRMYLTGGIGTSGSNEGFTSDFDLPNFSAYQETCASVALAMWNQRMALLFEDAKYADVMERSLYNAMLAGGSLNGRGYFYDNPLGTFGGHHRQGWFGCACCPPNLERTLGCLGQYAYGVSKDALVVNLFLPGEADIAVAGKRVNLLVKGDYPWDGKLSFELKPESPARFVLRIRVPDWASGAGLKLNGEARKTTIEKGYAVFDREWRPGDKVEMDLPMPVRRVEADLRVVENQGRLAIARGPLIYCLEGCDNDGHAVGISIPQDAALDARFEPDLLGGVVAITCEGFSREGKDDQLYGVPAGRKPVKVKAVPYCVWDNREPGDMQVWVPS